MRVLQVASVRNVLFLLKDAPPATPGLQMHRGFFTNPKSLRPDPLHPPQAAGCTMCSPEATAPLGNPGVG